jgi:hypothetical protein
MIVAGLLTTVLIILFMALHTTLTGWERLDDNSRRFDDLLLVDRTLDGIFTNTIPFVWRDENLTQNPVFVGTEEAVTLAYLHQVNRLDDGAIRFCRLGLEDGMLIAWYTERPPFPTDPDVPGVRRTVLARGVEEVHFSYADYQNGDVIFVEDWGDRLHAPMAVQLRIDWQDETSTTWLRRTAGTSYYERWGAWEQKVKP